MTFWRFGSDQNIVSSTNSISLNIDVRFESLSVRDGVKNVIVNDRYVYAIVK